MTAPTLWWVRKDFRLSDNAALHAAIDRGGPVIPVYILDDLAEGYGAAPKWRLGEAIGAFARTLEEKGSSLILRRGDPLETLRALIRDTGADAVVWGRQYDREAKERDAAVKAALKEDGVLAASVRNHLMFEPWAVETGQGGPYRVYSPFKRACMAREDEIGDPIPAQTPPAPDEWPESEALADWALGAAMNRGAAVLAKHAVIGERAAQGRLGAFIANGLGRYKKERDIPSSHAVSGLSENLAWGEISPRTAWAAAREAFRRDESTEKHGSHFLAELLWREFAYHLLHHYPSIPDRNWREQWDAFPWREDNADAERWKQGRTGVPMVDAAMREMYVSGTMHNRSRMIAASFLTKHLLTDWRVGEAWFRDCLIDWDPASNAMGWQWVAGCGPDAAPYFRIFNPETQAEKFDKDGAYIRRWVAEKEKGEAHKDALSYFGAIPRSWGLSAEDAYPAPVIGLKVGRERALEALGTLKPGENS